MKSNRTAFELKD